MQGKNEGFFGDTASFFCFPPENRDIPGNYSVYSDNGFNLPFILFCR